MANFQGQKNLRPEDKEKRFWSKVDKGSEDDCWNFKEGKTKNGYGLFGGKGAHRYAWKVFYKTKIPYGMLVLHKCNNPSCCNPRHLYIGTQVDNMNDMHSEGRRFSNARFYANEIWLIRRLKIPVRGYVMKYKFTQRFVAKMFKTSHSVIQEIWASDKHICKEGYYV